LPKKYTLEYEDATKRPRLTSDQEQWLDPDGNTPKVDELGRLLEPFVFQMSNGKCERWGVGMRLPEAPAPYARWLVEIKAGRAWAKPK
jgi:hypothetical protein